MASTPALIFDPRFREHDPHHTVRNQHPESPARYEALLPVVAQAEGFAKLEPGALDLRAIERVHDVAYVARLSALREQSIQLDEDTSLSPASVAAVHCASASLLTAVDAALAGEHLQSFCLVRPPGHHARPQQAMGFCVFNHVAVAAATARAKGVPRVCVIDWDVHPGNGTAEIFADDPDVLVVDLHQDGHWPGTGLAPDTGRGAGQGATLNIPLAPGANDGDMAAAFEHVVVPKVQAFAPELILVSAGFDAHLRDPLGQLALTAYGFADICARTLHLARTLANGRLVMSLEGGYEPEALAESVHTCLDTLAGRGPTWGPAPSRAPHAAVQGQLDHCRELHGLL